MKKILLSLFIVFFACACSSKSQHVLNYDPLEPHKVAVLPFYQKNEQGFVEGPVIFQTKNQSSDVRKRKTPPASILQTEIEEALNDTALHIVSPSTVRAHLVHKHYSKDHSYDYQKILERDPKTLGEELDADVLLYGELTEWSQSYYGVQSVNTIGLKLKLLGLHNNKVLFESDTVESDSRGLSGIPTGYSSLVLEPLKGLQESEIKKLAMNVAEEAIAPLLIKNQESYKKTPPPTIYAATHNLFDTRIKQNSPLKVLAVGSKNRTATFSIGENITNNPMVEIYPGHYVGSFYPLSNDRFDQQALRVNLYDRFGRSTEYSVGRVSFR